MSCQCSAVSLTGAPLLQIGFFISLIPASFSLIGGQPAPCDAIGWRASQDLPLPSLPDLGVTVYRSVMWSADFLISTSRTECPCTACLLTWENNAVRHLKNTNFCHKMLVRRQCGGTVGLRVATLRHETCWPPSTDDWPPHYWVVTALITPEKYQLAIAATLLLIFIIGEGEVGLKNVS